ncbi:MAG TPA: enoyl-CoA hydratase [Methyloceanibacter sp.]|nr:enoyl-CoA hydratase [Methyloceanibacter sp.]
MNSPTDLATAAAERILLRTDAQGIATLTLNRPKQYNALSEELLNELQSMLEQIEKDESVRVVVIAGNGAAFCAGHDLKQMRANPSKAYYQKLFAQCSKMMLTLTRLPQPVIARVHGIATAAGCQLVASCDLAVASSDARFATPGVNIGLFCSTPMVALSRNVSRKAAMEMLLLGEMTSAEHAKSLGLVNCVVESDRVVNEAMELGRKIAMKPKLTLKVGKEAFYRQLEMPLEEAYRYTSSVMVENMLDAEAEEGIGAFLDKRTPNWPR